MTTLRLWAFASAGKREAVRDHPVLVGQGPSRRLTDPQICPEGCQSSRGTRGSRSSDDLRMHQLPPMLLSLPCTLFPQLLNCLLSDAKTYGTGWLQRKLGRLEHVLHLPFPIVWNIVRT